LKGRAASYPSAPVYHPDALTGQIPALTVSYTIYSPSPVEWLVGFGILIFGLTFFSLGVRYLHVVDHTLDEAEQEPAPQPVSGREAGRVVV